MSALQAAVNDLQTQGIKCSLVENAVPRMYYRNQLGNLQRKDPNAYRFHENTEECDYVLKLNDSRYDVGFLYDNEGNLIPMFDDWQGHVRKLLGAPFKGGGGGGYADGQETERTKHSIGKLLQEYTKNTVIEAAAEQGHSVLSCELDEEGEYQLEIMVD